MTENLPLERISKLFRSFEATIVCTHLDDLSSFRDATVHVAIEMGDLCGASRMAPLALHGPRYEDIV
eukprot:scaffold2908_cov257-Pinguiococcus_pyrenoidosus.AAC.6